MEIDKSISNINSRERTKHISGMDVLKTLAIVGVTLFHVFPNNAVGGYLGVSLFFVLTGFLLAYTSRKNWLAGKYTVPGYYLKRLKRIYPSLIMVIFVSLGAFALAAPKVLEGIHSELLSIFLGYNNWWQISQNADYFARMTNTSPFTHLWFMGIELQYYLIWPVIFGIYIWLSRKVGEGAGRGVIGAFAIAASAAMPVMYAQGFDITRLYYGTDTRIYALLLGAVIGLAFRNTKPKHISRKDSRSSVLPELLLAGTIGITIYIFAYLDGQNPLLYQGGMLAVTLLFCLMVSIVAKYGQQMSYILDNSVLCWPGRKSYSIFLWQFPVIHMFKVMHLTAIPYYYIWEIAAILVLAACSEYLSNCIIQKRIPFVAWILNEKNDISKQVANPTHDFKSLVIQTVTGVLMIASAGLMAYGAYSTAVASPTAKNEFQASLKAQMDENRQSMKDDNAQATAAAKAKAADHGLQVKEQADLSGITCIGDSVMLGSASALRKVLPDCYIDAEVSRYVGDGIDIVRELKRAGTLGNIVVIALGTNGPIAGQDRYEEQTQALLKELGDDRLIFWVNVYCPDLSWHEINNDYINKMAAEHKNITVIDWCGMVSNHTDWLVEDGVHPETFGITMYAKLVHDTIEWKLKYINEKK